MATADQIVDTAVELGEQRSWEAVRLHDIAASLGITLDDVRAYFREKEDIVDAWFERADSGAVSLPVCFAKLLKGRIAQDDAGCAERGSEFR